MSILRSIPFLLLSIPLLLNPVLGVDPLYHICPTSNNFTANGPYDNNLQQLMASLSTQVPLTGFGLGSFGRSPDRANGLALCRGDVSSADCKTCINGATSEIRRLCPYSEQAIIWYDHCLLSYSDVKFFGQIDTSNKVYLLNVKSVDDPKMFNHQVGELLTGLSWEASHSPLMFAKGEVELGESKKLYGLTQCTRDLSYSDCKKCLESAISELPSCCDGKEGGRVLGGSCNIRYELYPFLDV
ncbi:cysteine-rich repeat secretory protein 38 [Cinnamomum micranthum f. kanehirae]|uniref:Cysteine-rich repeat secretory protein 38 n=1 Tax=Cinnamomum micranthum f. kanehirae TaxID=337451 RepID=A0A3S3NX64_9MAGN|nr:cysteine-rich repeat secretory protein 38 [Cinnamomum micranthum f. kanehirae]